MTMLTPEQLLNAYRNGYFPMALSHDDPELYWFAPEERGVIPLEGFNIPRGLRRAMKSRDYTVTFDRDFEGVIRACGQVNATRDETWINAEIIALYTALHRMGHAHSVEVWEAAPEAKEDSCVASHGEPEGRGSAQRAKGVRPPSGKLVGGLYGVSIGGAFFGESMFSRAADASKIALVALVERLRAAGYTLLDTQYVNEHLKQFGVMGIPKADYMMKLEKALSASPNPSMRFSTASVRSGAASASSLSDTSPS
jgi:leucyl/phenylalanyl-tRNA--protein transferase